MARKKTKKPAEVAPKLSYTQENIIKYMESQQVISVFDKHCRQYFGQIIECGDDGFKLEGSTNYGSQVYTVLTLRYDEISFTSEFNLETVRAMIKGLYTGPSAEKETLTQ